MATHVRPRIDDQIQLRIAVYEAAQFAAGIVYQESRGRSDAYPQPLSRAIVSFPSSFF